MQRNLWRRCLVGFLLNFPEGSPWKFTAPLITHPGLPLAGQPRVGQQFLRIEGDITYLAGGKPVPYASLMGRSITLKAWQGNKAVFDAGTLGQIVRQASVNDGFSDLAPLVDDPELKRLKQMYEGKTVWAYGGVSGWCELSPTLRVGMWARPQMPLKVLRVLRLSAPMRLDPQSTGEAQGMGVHAMTLTPLVFLLDPQPIYEVGSVIDRTGPQGDAPDAEEAWLVLADQAQQRVEQGKCGNATFPVYLADTWVTERVFSFQRPPLGLKTERDIDGVGLTRQQYAWIHGYPDFSYGTKAEVNTLSTWTYRHFGPDFTRTVKFDAVGRVNSVIYSPY